MSIKIEEVTHILSLRLKKSVQKQIGGLSVPNAFEEIGTLHVVLNDELDRGVYVEASAFVDSDDYSPDLKAELGELVKANIPKKYKKHDLVINLHSCTM